MLNFNLYELGLPSCQELNLVPVIRISFQWCSQINPASLVLLYHGWHQCILNIYPKIEE